jgi:hypothetical protein
VTFGKWLSTHRNSTTYRDAQAAKRVAAQERVELAAAAAAAAEEALAETGDSQVASDEDNAGTTVRPL